MPSCLACRQPATKRHGREGAGRQRFLCKGCRRSFTRYSASAFAGYRWPREAILTAVRWYLGHPLSATSVMLFLAERGIDVSKRTVLRWVQTFGPLLAAELRKHRRRPSSRWWVDEVFFFRNEAKEKRYCENGGVGGGGHDPKRYRRPARTGLPCTWSCLPAATGSRREVVALA